MPFNPIELLRLRSILGSQQQPTMQTTGPYSGGAEINPMLMQSMNNPPQQQGPAEDNYMPTLHNEANQQFMSKLNTMPQREDPSVLRRIGAIATGIAHGPEEEEKQLYAPFMRKLADWKSGMEPLKDAAMLERQQNTSMANIFGMDRRYDIAERNADTRAKAGEETARSNREKEEVNRRAQDLKELIAKRPDLKWELDENNQYVGMDTKGGQPIKSGITSNQLSDAQKLSMGLQNALKRIQAAGDVDAGLEGLKQEGRLNLETKKEDAKTGKGELPSQTKVRNYNRAQEAYNTHPDWKQFIVLGQPGTNDFQLKQPSAFRDATRQGYAKTYEEVAKYIYGPNWKSLIGPGTTNAKDPAGIRK